MVQKKICMIGSFAVGKTSLVEQFVHSLFSEKYKTTIGVKIDRKMITVGSEEVNLVLWDIHGDDEFQRIRDSYLRGASGYFLVIDGTRRETWNEGLLLQRRVAEVLGDCPFLILLNKRDLDEAWEITAELTAEESKRGSVLLETSAKTGAGVEEAFVRLARMMLEQTT